MSPIWLLAALPALAAEIPSETGLPFLRTFTRQEYGAHPQNWAAAQDRRGVMYFANNDAILEYDGARWRAIPTPNASNARSLLEAGDGVVYVGCQGDFGYLSDERYVSLLEHVPEAERAFKDVWQVIDGPDGVYFRADERLFRWSATKGMRSWKAEQRFHRAYRMGGEIYVNDQGAGLKRIHGDTLEMAPVGRRFRDLIVRFAEPRKDGQWLIGVADEFLLWDGRSFRPLPTGADRFLRARKLYQAVRLPTGELALAFESGGLALLGPEGRLLAFLDEKTGLAADRVNYIFPDRQGGLWLALNNGLARVEIPSPLSLFDQRAGLKGAVAAIARHQGSLYAATYFGVSRLTGREFSPILGIAIACWALESTEAGLLAGCGDGVYLVNGGAARRLASGRTVYALRRSARDPSIVYAGGLEGLSTLRPSAGGWRLTEKVAGVTMIVREIAEDSNGSLWLGSNFEGVARVGPSGIETFGPRAGLPSNWTKPFDAGGRIVFATAQGIFRFERGAFVRDNSFGLDPGWGVHRLAGDGSGGVWINTTLDTGRFGAKGWDSLPLRRLRGVVVHAIYPESDAVWIGTETGLVRFDPSQPKNYAAPVAALLRSPFLPGARLRHSSDPLRFEFSAPVTDDDQRTEFQFDLDGFEKPSEVWSRETQKDYTNLFEGRYVFRVRARSLYGAVSGFAEAPFTILPPWYRSWAAYLFYAGWTGCLVYFLFQWRLSHLKARNRLLEETIAARTQEKDEFLGIAAHDLKNPLSELRLGARMMQVGPDAISQAEVGEYLRSVETSAGHMLDIVSNLLDINRIEQGTLVVRKNACDLAEIAGKAVKAYRRRAESKQIELRYESEPTMICADALLLEQVLDNLLSNAIKYSPLGKKVLVRVKRSTSSAHIEVEDQGPGLTSQDRSRLFGKFARLSARPTAGESSTGLGLAITKRLVDAMGGNISCEGRPGEGATFRVELP